MKFSYALSVGYEAHWNYSSSFTKQSFFSFYRLLTYVYQDVWSIIILF